MTVLVKSLADGQLSDSTGDLYTVSASTTAIVESIKLVNTHSSAITVNIYILPSGGSARRITSVDLSLAAGYSCEVLDQELTLSASDKIRGDGSTASKVDYVISGMEIT